MSGDGGQCPVSIDDRGIDLTGSWMLWTTTPGVKPKPRACLVCLCARSSVTWFPFIRTWKNTGSTMTCDIRFALYPFFLHRSRSVASSLEILSNKLPRDRRKCVRKLKIRGGASLNGRYFRRTFYRIWKRMEEGTSWIEKLEDSKCSSFFERRNDNQFFCCEFFPFLGVKIKERPGSNLGTRWSALIALELTLSRLARWSLRSMVELPLCGKLGFNKGGA